MAAWERLVELITYVSLTNLILPSLKDTCMHTFTCGGCCTFHILLNSHTRAFLQNSKTSFQPSYREKLILKG